MSNNMIAPLTTLHKQYKDRMRRKSMLVLLTQMILLVGFIAIWEWSSKARIVDPLIFSSPSKIANHLYTSLLDGSILPHIGITVAETIAGFLLGTLLGTLIAALLWWFPFVARVFDPFLVVLNSMPKVALGPLLIVGLGPGFGSIVAITLLVTVIITTINIYNRFRETEEGLLKVATIFGATRFQTFYYVILPAAFPVIISTLKVNVGLAWIGVIVGEFLVARVGLGYLIIYGFQVFNFTLVLSTLVVIAFVATFMYQAVSFLERKVTSGWKDR
ncbi:ABC transporter permease [Paenibacillus sp. FSL W7-1287]|uniref:ABC transporter permease n=1 Tax=Paenibacillus sp. FSL W7-1287 TaxID=2954538 RepID=UPI0030F5100E